MWTVVKHAVRSFLRDSRLELIARFLPPPFTVLKPPVTMAPVPTAPKLLSLLSSTLPLVLERARSVSLSHTPSPFTESTIVRNLALVTEGILYLESSDGTASGEMIEKVRSGRERLLIMMEGDEAGREKVREVRARLG